MNYKKLSKIASGEGVKASPPSGYKKGVSSIKLSDELKFMVERAANLPATSKSIRVKM